jgi:hypothetical protein
MIARTASHLFAVAVILAAWTGSAESEWLPNGTPVTDAPGPQYLRAAISDGAGGLYVVWFDTGSWFGRRLLGDGEPAPGWPATGTPVPSGQVTSDQQGGLLFCRVEGESVYVARRGPDGLSPAGWPVQGVGVARLLGTPLSGLSMTADQTGGAYVAWDHTECIPIPGGPCYLTLSMARIDGNGAVAWVEAVGSLLQTGGLQESQQLVSTPAGSVFVMSYSGLRLVNSSGGVQWHLLWGWEGNDVHPGLPVGDGVGGILLVLRHYSDQSIRAIRFTSSGTVAPGWSPSGNVVSTVGLTSGVDSDGSQGVLVTWYDPNTQQSVIQRVNGSGQIAPGWPAAGTPAGSPPGAAIVLAGDGTGGAYFAWSYGPGVFARRIDGDGALDDRCDEIPVSTAPGVQHQPMILSDGAGGAFLVWEDDRVSANERDVYASRVTCDASTATTLSLFEAREVDDVVEVRWRFAEPASDVHLERGSSTAGPWIAVDVEPGLDGETRVARDPSTTAGQTYFYRLVVRDRNGGLQAFGPLMVARSAAPTTSLELLGPNPGSGSFPVAFQLSERTQVRLTVHDLQGRQVAELVNGIHDAGEHQAVWRAGGAPAGIYFLRYQASQRRSIHRVAIVR